MKAFSSRLRIYRTFYLGFLVALILLVAKSELSVPTSNSIGSSSGIGKIADLSPKRNRSRWHSPIISTISAAARLSKSAVITPFTAASYIIRKPIRDASFWGKALTIYGSYKVHQVKSKMGNTFSINRKKDAKWEELKQNRTDKMWNFIHEANSKRMVNLCLGMRGFYLKTGQFLGTRHDFMPKSYTVILTLRPLSLSLS